MLRVLVLILGGATVAPVLLLQFLPAKYTLTTGALGTLPTRRGTLWALPWHMLSNFGRGLRLLFYAMLAVDSVIVVAAYVTWLL